MAHPGAHYLALVCSFVLVVGAGCRSNENPAPAPTDRAPADGAPQARYQEHALLVRFAPPATESTIASITAELGATVLESFAGAPATSPNRRLRWLRLPDDMLAADAKQRLSGRSEIELADFNYIVDATEVYRPNDPELKNLWGLENVGTLTPQHGGPLPARADADVDAPEAWGALRQLPMPASPVIVAVLDTGVDYRHPDLAAGIWTNPGEIAGNGIDDDNDGYVDDVHGYDFFSNDGDPMDENNHGTHVAGIIAASSDNDVGVAGLAKVASPVVIMPLRFLDPEGSGSIADSIRGIYYAANHGAQVINGSYGRVGSVILPELDALREAASAGVMFVAAAGNDHLDNDSSPDYPSTYDIAGLLSVAATNRYDVLATFDDWGGASNWGATSVDLAAPGQDILSTSADGKYDWLDGTSMAAPQVSAAAAMIIAHGFAMRPVDVARLILESTEPVPDLACRVASGGRLNVANIVERGTLVDQVAPAPVTDLTLLRAGGDVAVLRWTASGDDGMNGQAMRYDLRFAPRQEWTSFESGHRTCAGLRPGIAGKVDVLTLSQLTPGIEYVAQLKVLDDGNNGTLSNELSFQSGLRAPSADAVIFEEKFTDLSRWETVGDFSVAAVGTGGLHYRHTPTAEEGAWLVVAATLRQPLDLSRAVRARLDASYVITSGPWLRIEASTDGDSWHALGVIYSDQPLSATFDLEAELGHRAVLLRVVVEHGSEVELTIKRIALSISSDPVPPAADAGPADAGDAPLVSDAAGLDAPPEDGAEPSDTDAAPPDVSVDASAGANDAADGANQDGPPALDASVPDARAETPDAQPAPFVIDQPFNYLYAVVSDHAGGWWGTGHVYLGSACNSDPAGPAAAMMVMHVLANGTLDRSFGSNGTGCAGHTNPTAFVYNYPHAIAVDAVGRIVIAGESIESPVRAAST